MCRSWKSIARCFALIFLFSCARIQRSNESYEIRLARATLYNSLPKDCQEQLEAIPPPIIKPSNRGLYTSKEFKIEYLRNNWQSLHHEAIHHYSAHIDRKCSLEALARIAVELRRTKKQLLHARIK